MTTPTSRIRAVGLLSGGLDSALAARLLLDQGIEVIGLHLEAPTACRSDVRQIASELGIQLVTRSKGEEYLKLLRNPKWGYGKQMNPCVDCRHFMLRLAAGYLDELDARFLFTGEVLGQRPMSQMRSSIDLIDRESGLGGWILRPLSALLLPETEPEKRGWVDRGKLLGIQGRSREIQLALARRYGLRHHASPGGGCLLTDPHFAARVRDLFGNTTEAETTMEDLALLRLGHHFRERPDLKIVVGRNRDENEALRRHARADRWILEPHDFPGPTALVLGPRDSASIERATELIVAHTRAVPPGASVRWWEGEAEIRRRVGGASPVEPAATSLH